jgi:hypothetical protein
MESFTEPITIFNYISLIEQLELIGIIHSIIISYTSRLPLSPRVFGNHQFRQ